MKRCLILAGMMLILGLLTACAAPTTPIQPTNPPTAEPPRPTWTPVPTLTPVPSHTPTAMPTKVPTATPTQVFTLATSAEEILGTWHMGSYYYIRFDKDGTFRQADALDKLDSKPYAISSYQFKGTKMVITEIKVSGVPTCGKKIGSYEIQLRENGNIWIVAIKDECAPRAGDVAGEYEPVR